MEKGIHSDRRITVKALANAFQARQTQLSNLDEKYWTIIGSGSIGAKAEELRRKGWAIEKAGFELYPRTVFAMGFFKDFMERNGIIDAAGKGVSSDMVMGLVDYGQFNKKEYDVIRAVSHQFGDVPLAVRSSAQGDSRGTGIYDSTFCPPLDTQELVHAIKKVLASQFTPSAIAFRKDLGLEEGIAVMVEPVFGETRVKERAWTPNGYGMEHIYGPLFGGVAYSSTAQGAGYAVLCAGMPLRAAKGRGMKMRDGQQSINDVWLETLENDEKTFEYFVTAGAGIDRNLEVMEILEHRELIYVSNITRHERTISSEPRMFILAHEMEWSETRFANEKLDWLFLKLKTLESLLGKPQYAEWAALENGSNTRIALMQIADVDKKMDFFEFAASSKTAIKSTCVVGSGEQECDEIAYVFNPHEIDLIKEYNKTHNGYVAIYDGRLTSNMYSTFRPLGYYDISNASVVIELSYGGHVKDPIEHFKGLMDTTKKIFMVVDEVNWDHIKPFRTPDNRLRVYDVKTKVTASERQQRAVVEIIENEQINP